LAERVPKGMASPGSVCQTQIALPARRNHEDASPVPVPRQSEAEVPVILADHDPFGDACSQERCDVLTGDLGLFVEAFEHSRCGMRIVRTELVRGCSPTMHRYPSRLFPPGVSDSDPVGSPRIQEHRRMTVCPPLPPRRQSVGESPMKLGEATSSAR